MSNSAVSTKALRGLFQRNNEQAPARSRPPDRPDRQDRSDRPDWEVEFEDRETSKHAILDRISVGYEDVAHPAPMEGVNRRHC